MEKKYIVLGLDFMILSLLYLLLYSSNINLTYISEFQASLISILFLSAKGIFISLAPLLLYSLSLILLLSFLYITTSLSELGRLKLFLAIPLAIFPYFFNFSVSAMFLSVGIFVSLLISEKLGKIYLDEIRDYKKLRFGIKLSAKLLFITYSIFCLGIFLQLSMNESYAYLFLNESLNRTAILISSQYKYFLPEKESLINLQLEMIKQNYNITDEDKLKLIRRELEESYNETATINETQLQKIFLNNFRNSDLAKVTIRYYPILTALVAYSALSVLSFLSAPFFALFSCILFKIFKEE